MIYKNVNIGRRLREYREKHEITLEEVADAVNRISKDEDGRMRAAYLSDLETGKRKTINTDTLIRICNALGIMADQLLQ